MNFRIVIALAAGIALFASASAPAQFRTPSSSQQIKLGEQAAQELRRQERVLPSTDARVQLVRRVARRLLANIPSKEPWEFSFDVIDKKELNAFSLPGGPTFVYTGLLDKLVTEDELAGIMGHELTHVRLQHWAKAYAAQQRRNLLLTLGLTLLRANNNVANLAGVSSELLFDLPFSRKDENEADQGGFDMMIAAGYNPQGLADVFRLLQTSGGGKVPEFLSDHPSDKNRISRIEQWVHNANHEFPAQRPLNLGHDERVNSFGGG